LSKEAVDPMVERARERLVLPESTWPSTPTLMLSVFAGLGFDEDEDASASDMLASVCPRHHVLLPLADQS